jgi:hypothetical protein
MASESGAKQVVGGTEYLGIVAVCEYLRGGYIH